LAALVSALAITTANAQPRRAAPCDALAAQVRSRAAAAADGDPWKQVSTGADAVIVPARSTRMAADAASDSNPALEAFRKRFSPNPPLAAAVRTLLELSDGADLWQWPNGRLHALEVDGGTAHCQSFVFFETHPNGASTLVPDPPGDDERCAGFGMITNLARVGGSEALVEYSFSTPGDSFGFNVIPERDGAWGASCRVSVSYASTFHADYVFTDPKGPLGESAFRTLAEQIVERWAASDESDDFRFGPPVAAADQSRADTMLELAGRLGTTAVPMFGRDATLDPTEDSTNTAKVYPLVIDGKTYILQVGRSNIGWRTFRTTIAIVYTLNGDELTPIASAVVDQLRGALKSVTTKP